MSMIGLKVPAGIAEKLSKISVPGKKESAEMMHITMFYFEKELTIKNILTITKILYDAVKNVPAFSIKGKKALCFPNGKYGYPIIVPIESDELLNLRKAIAKKFDTNDVKYSKKFPEYKPHLTLSYSPKEMEEKKIESVSWKSEEIVIWGGTDDEPQVIVSIPFSFGKKASKFELGYIYSEIFEKLATG